MVVNYVRSYTESGRKPRHLFTAAFDPNRTFAKPGAFNVMRSGKLAPVHLISIIVATCDFTDLVILGRSCVAIGAVEKAKP